MGRKDQPSLVEESRTEEDVELGSEMEDEDPSSGETFLVILCCIIVLVIITTALVVSLINIDIHVHVGIGGSSTDHSTQQQNQPKVDSSISSVPSTTPCPVIPTATEKYHSTQQQNQPKVDSSISSVPSTTPCPVIPTATEKCCVVCPPVVHPTTNNTGTDGNITSVTSTRGSALTSTTSAATRTTTAITTTTTTASSTPGKPKKPYEDARNFTLICVFEYLSPIEWNKTDQCTDYVFIGLFSYTEVSSYLITFVKKSLTPPGKFGHMHYDDHQETWRDYDIKLYNKIKIAMKKYPHARWLYGMWGSAYMRLMAALFNVNKMRAGLHDALRATDIGGGLSMANFSGFAIIHSPIYNTRVMQVSPSWTDIFRTDKFGPAALEPNWFFLHTASIDIWYHQTPNREQMIREVMANANLMGLATSNTTYEDNMLLLRLGYDYYKYKQASPPNPIRAANENVSGMLDTLKTFPYWKKTLNQSRLCFSVTSAINYASSNARTIDFYDEIGGQHEAVQRYTRMRFARRGLYGGARMLPVEEKDCTYEFDNKTQTHFWKWYYRGKMLLFFAYDKADTLGPKVTELLNAYPGDKCIVFDDLGEDGRGAKWTARGVTVEFKAYELLHAIVEAMTARYGPAFPAQYY